MTPAAGVDGVDVVVVGGGPAGLAVAIRARLAGLEVVVLDRGARGHDKACGEGLMPRALAAMHALGVRLPSGASRRFRGIRFVQRSRDGGEQVAQGMLPGRGGLGVRRTVLHEAMATRALELGARIPWSVTARGLAADGMGVETDSGATLRARWVVGADGLHSCVRRWAGLDAGEGPRRRFGIRRHHAVAPWTDCVEVHWCEDAEAFVTPVSERLVGVNVTWHGPPARFDDLIARFPTLCERLAAGPVVSDDRGAGPMHQRVRGVASGRIALVGDAAGYLDSITGEGIGLALLQAGALVDGIVAGSLHAYGAACRRIARPSSLATHAMLLAARHPSLRRRAIAGLADHPRWFDGVLRLACDAPIGPQANPSGRMAPASLTRRISS